MSHSHSQQLSETNTANGTPPLHHSSTNGGHDSLLDGSGVGESPTAEWTDDLTEGDIDGGIGLTDESLTDPERFWEDQWSKFEPYIRPFEADRSAYRQYPRPLIITCRTPLWLRLTKNNGLRRAVDGMMLLGFIPTDLKMLEGELDPTQQETVRFHMVDQARAGQRVSFDDPPEVEPAEKVRELEYEVRELTKQLRLLRSRDSGHKDSQSPSPLLPPVPQVVTTKPYLASISGNTPVCLQLNYLDPDVAPYFVSLATLTGRQILPCTVVNHRYILFIAPAHPGGSVACSVLCTGSTGALRKYAKSIWLEYKDLGQTLSHHAVNQLVSDIPLPSTLSAPDPSEVGMNTEGKSEGDALEDVETSTALSNDNISLSVGDEHPPLTREMLDMLTQPKVVFTGVSSINRPSRQPESLDGAETLASSLAVTHVTQGGSVVGPETVSVSQATSERNADDNDSERNCNSDDDKVDDEDN